MTALMKRSMHGWILEILICFNMFLIGIAKPYSIISINRSTYHVCILISLMFLLYNWYEFYYNQCHKIVPLPRPTILFRARCV